MLGDRLRLLRRHCRLIGNVAVAHFVRPVFADAPDHGETFAMRQGWTAIAGQLFNLDKCIRRDCAIAPRTSRQDERGLVAMALSEAAAAQCLQPPDSRQLIAVGYVEPTTPRGANAGGRSSGR